MDIDGKTRFSTKLAGLAQDCDDRGLVYQARLSLPASILKKDIRRFYICAAGATDQAFQSVETATLGMDLEDRLEDHGQASGLKDLV
jgi:hypothetical protein